MKRIDVIIYFEHVVRELDACLKLRNELERIGLSVKVASIHYNRYINILRYQPKVLVLPFFYATKDRTYFQFKAAYGNVLVLNLHQEQLYNASTKAFFIPQSEITKNVYHIAWSESFYKDLLGAGIKPELVKLTGNPRTDNFYLNLPKKMKAFEGKDVVFIPTSFSWYFVDSDYFLSNPAIDNDAYYFQRDITEKTVMIFFKSLRLFAREFPNKTFVVRPHPFDPIDKYKQVLEDIDKGYPIENNIIINREGNIYEWLRVSNLVITWLSTVAMEATIFKKNNIVWQPIELPEKMQMEFIGLYDKIYKTEDEVRRVLINPMLVENNMRVKEFACKSFGRVDGTVNRMIAEWIKEIIEDVNIEQKVLFSGVIINFIKYVLIDVPKCLLRRMRLIDRFPFYKPIEEDLWSVSEIDKKYNLFKKELL